MKSEPVSKNKSLEVYEPQTPSDCPPDDFTDSEDATRLVANGDATRINRGKAIRLKRGSITKPFERSETLRRISIKPGAGVGLSAQPNAALIERHAMATISGLDQAAIVAVRAWRGPVNG